MSLPHEGGGTGANDEHRHSTGRYDGRLIPESVETYALRTFAVGIDGALYSPFHDDGRPWADGVNIARCTTGRHEPPQPSCACGLYAYWDATHEPLADARTWAVVACTGGALAGHRGLRAARMRVVALWVDERDGGPDGATWRELVARYPSVVLYRSREAMLAAHLPAAAGSVPPLGPVAAIPPLVGSAEAVRRGGRRLAQSRDVGLLGDLGSFAPLAALRPLVEISGAVLVSVTLLGTSSRPLLTAGLLAVLGAAAALLRKPPSAGSDEGDDQPDARSRPPGPTRRD